MSAQKRIPSVLNSYEQIALLKQPNRKAPTGLRNLCIISLMLKTGLRVSEMLKLKHEDIDWDDGTIYINESGAALGRTLLIAQAELELLDKWRRIKPPNSIYLFSTLKGGCLKDRYIREMIKRLARKAGINKDVHPYVLRYTFAVDFMKETGNIERLQGALGHRDPGATKAYLKLFFEDYHEPIADDATIRRSGTPVLEEEQKCFADFKKSAVLSTEITKEEQNMNNTNANTAGYVQTVEADVNLSITVFTENSGLENISIPAIKCSRCDYIIRYQGDCPQCGASFVSILRHWGRNI